MLTLPTGIDDFRELREKNKYYVDKTLMIRDFIQYDDKVALITRPRRFGKTLNMTMLREFFDLNKDSKEIFEGLAIMETEYARLINTKPVIYLTFKNCSGANMDDLKDSLASQMIKEYDRFATEFKDKVDSERLAYFAFYETYSALKQVLKARPKNERKISQVDTHIFKRSLTTLIQAVSTFYDQHPILLIDEYDQPLINAHDENFREEFSKRIYADFLGEALKGNGYLGQNVLTGIQRVAKESIFSKLNNFVVYTVLDEMYAPYFGLTEVETKEALEQAELVLTDDVKRYYDGYVMGGIGIYNPWSILTYMLKKKLEPYWVNTSTNGLIKEAIPKADKGFHENFERLIRDKEVRISSNLEASFVELATPQTLWGLLINSGYLTVTKVFLSGATRVKIPNQEVKKEFREIVVDAYGKIVNTGE
ncbi:MAG: AAA family ATPase [Defluviitaleaceae bacterium]|nr:AAA family ATPase [Defluviitaleaceae bacterium]